MFFFSQANKDSPEFEISKFSKIMAEFFKNLSIGYAHDYYAR